MNSTMDYAERRMARQRAREARDRAYEERMRDGIQVAAMIVGGMAALIGSLHILGALGVCG